MAVDQRQRQAHHVEVAAVDFLDKFRSQVLNGVGSGFVHGLAAGNVVGNFGIGERGEADLRGRVVYDCAVVVQQTDAGDDGVVASGKQAQHGVGIGSVGGFLEYVVIDDYGGVCAQDDFAGALPGGFGFGARQAADIVDGGFTRTADFFDGFYAHGETESGYRQQFAAAGGLRG